MDSMSITDLHKIRSWSLSGEARPPWPLLPVIDGSHLVNLGIRGKRFNALFNGTLGEALPDQYITYSYRHVRASHIINLHIRTTNSNFPMKCMDFRSP